MRKHHFSMVFLVSLLLATMASASVMVTSCLAPSLQQVINGLVGYWNFDQGSGTIAYDGSGYNNHGNIYGASWTNGKVNTALNFDGLNDYVDCGNNATLDPIQEATIEAWVDFGQLPSVANHYMAIAGRSGGGTDFDLQTETDNRFKFYIGTGYPNVAVSNTVVETHEWYHVVGTYQANNNIKIYVNGLLEKTTSIAITRGTNPNKFCIGQSSYWPGRFFNGTIDEVKIYNRALSAEEIWAEYTRVYVSISPSSHIMDVGQSQQFTSSVSGGTLPYSYQWYLDDAPVSGATSTSWTLMPTIPGSYTVYLNVTDAVGTSAASNIATATVNSLPSPNISPSSATLDVGQSQQFTSKVSGGTSPYTYQWYLDNVAVSGATSATWTFTPESPNSYMVYLKVTDAVSVAATSNTATATANEALSAGISPSSTTLDVSLSQLFTSTISGGTSPYTYQWYLNSIAVSGATSSNWTFAANSAGSYKVYVNVTDSVSFEVKSNIASVTVNLFPSVTISPSSVAMFINQSKQFTSTTSGGTPPYTYQWYLNGSLVSGATSNSWTFSLTSSGSSTIYLIATDALGVTAVSPTVTITVRPAPELPFLAIAAVIVVIVVLGASLFLLRRRR